MRGSLKVAIVTGLLVASTTAGVVTRLAFASGEPVAAARLVAARQATVESPTAPAAAGRSAAASTGFLLLEQNLPGVEADLWVDGHELVHSQPYSQVPVRLGLAPGRVHLSARLVGAKGKERLRARFTVEAGVTTTVRLAPDDQGRATLTLLPG